MKYDILRARELLEDLPEPLTFKKMVGEVNKTMQEMQRASRRIRFGERS